MLETRPNVLFIINHDLGRHLECYGNKSIQTPNINKLAGEGVLFENYFAPSPLCSPSRGSISTGRYPHCNGLIGLAHIGWSLNTEEVTMAKRFKDGGYSTHLFGFQHESHDPFSLGYDTVLHGKNLCHETTPLVNEFLEDYAENGEGRPFFTMVGFEETHRPYPKELYEYDNPEGVEVPPYLPDHPLVRQDIAQLHGSVRKMDLHVGQIMDTLERSGLKGSTIVVFTTDHGIAFPRAKSTLYDPGLETVLIMRWPEEFEGGRKCSELLSNVDLLPSLLELTGLNVDHRIQGRTFAPWLLDEEYESREEIYGEKTWHDSYDPMRCIRTKRYKYIRNYIPGPSLVLPGDIAASLSMQALGPKPLAEPRPQDELYDLDRDPDEQKNLAYEPEYEEIREQLKHRLEKWMKETGDPLVNGHIFMPGTPGV